MTSAVLAAFSLLYPFFASCASKNDSRWKDCAGAIGFDGIRLAFSFSFSMGLAAIFTFDIRFFFDLASSKIETILSTSREVMSSEAPVEGLIVDVGSTGTGRV